MKIYRGGGRPTNSRKLRVLFALFKMPVINKLVRRHLMKALNLPKTAAINQGFYCSAPNIEVGECTGLGNLYIIALEKVKIGSHCSFSFNNIILTSTHDYQDFSVIVAKPVVIGDSVWVTSNVTILPGVTIGSNTIIGAGSVVTKDIPSGVFAAGNPCKVIKRIQFNIK